MIVLPDPLCAAPLPLTFKPFETKSNNVVVLVVSVSAVFDRISVLVGLYSFLLSSYITQGSPAADAFLAITKAGLNPV